MKILKTLLIGLVVTLLITGCSRTTTGIENYLESGSEIDMSSSEVMPSLDSLPEYESIEYIYTHKSGILFESDSIVLVVKYDENTYRSESERIGSEYVYLEDKVKSDFDNSKYYIPESQFTINDYTFRVVDEKTNTYNKYPKSFGMIGTSEKNTSIAYMYFYDLDLDYIRDDGNEPMADFVNNHFNYEF